MHVGVGTESAIACARVCSDHVGLRCDPALLAAVDNAPLANPGTPLSKQLPPGHYDIHVGKWEESGPKVVSLPIKGLDVLPEPVNPQDPSWDDAFEVSVVDDQLSVRRADSIAEGGGWGQDLVLRAKPATPLADELAEMFFSVTRTWHDFEWLHARLTEDKRKPPPLPKSGAGRKHLPPTTHVSTHHAQ